MELNDYQIAARRTAIYPGQGTDVVYCTLGLNGEAGEVAEKIKKIIRDKGGKLTDTDVMDLQKELGDVLWYLSNLACDLELNLEDIAVCNLDKLSSRAKRGVLTGSGDDR